MGRSASALFLRPRQKGGQAAEREIDRPLARIDEIAPMEDEQTERQEPRSPPWPGPAERARIRSAGFRNIMPARTVTTYI